MDTLDNERILKKYSSLEIIWDKSDKWHYWTFKQISRFISEIKGKYLPGGSIPDYKILNAGSGGNGYGFSNDNVYHVDIVEDKVKNYKYHAVCSIENLPFEDEQFDLIICVGSVINYCDPYNSIKEFKRVLKKGGCLILEYENSNSLELVGKKEFNKKAVIVDTFYYGSERLWYYSSSFINEILRLENFELLKKRPIHILSPLVYRITKNENLASYFGYLDSLLMRVPIIKNISSNTILFAKKQE